MEEKDSSHDSQLPQAPPAGGQPPRDHACDLPFPILDFSDILGVSLASQQADQSLGCTPQS